MILNCHITMQNTAKGCAASNGSGLKTIAISSDLSGPEMILKIDLVHLLNRGSHK